MISSRQMAAQMAARARATAWRWTLQSGARSRSMFRSGAARRPISASSSRLLVAKATLDQLRPPKVYVADGPLGSSAFAFEPNYRDAAGVPCVVLRCILALPGSGSPAFALAYDKSFTPKQVQFDADGRADCDAEDRVLLLLGNFKTANGAYYHVRRPGDGGTDNAANYQCVFYGRFHGRPFVVGSNGLGCFLDLSLEHILVARPRAGKDQRFWAGRGEAISGGSVTLTAENPFAPSESRLAKYQVRATDGAQTVVLTANARDDAGDALILFDTRAAARTPGFVVINREVKFRAPANARDRAGHAIFVARANTVRDGNPTFAVEGMISGSARVRARFEGRADTRDAKGHSWFQAKATTTADGIDRPVFEGLAQPVNAVSGSSETDRR